jgi:hypothetical protein
MVLAAQFVQFVEQARQAGPLARDRHATLDLAQQQAVAAGDARSVHRDTPRAVVRQGDIVAAACDGMAIALSPL